MPDSWGSSGPAGPSVPPGSSGSAGPSGSAGSSGSAGRGWRSPRPLILAGVAVAALGSGAGVAFAATSGSPSPAASASAIAATPSPSSSSQPSPSQRRAGAGPWRGFARPGARPGFGRVRRFGPGGGLGLFGVLHGQFTVPKPGGGYRTVDIQRGQVTAVSASSITLKSADGFTTTYAVQAATIVDAQRGGISSVKVGNQATVLATVSAGTASAVRIADNTLLQAARGQFGSRGVEPGQSGQSGQAGGTTG